MEHRCSVGYQMYLTLTTGYPEHREALSPSPSFTQFFPLSLSLLLFRSSLDRALKATFQWLVTSSESFSSQASCTTLSNPSRSLRSSFLLFIYIIISLKYPLNLLIYKCLSCLQKLKITNP